MKKETMLAIAVFIFLLRIFQGDVFGVATSSALTGSDSAKIKEDKNIIDLKNKLANITRKKDQKAIAGFVSVKGENLYVVNEGTGEEFLINIDDSLTNFYQIVGVSKKEVKKSEIKKDMYIIVTGPVVEKTINANQIYIDEAFIVQTGKITGINKEDYSLTILTLEKEEYTLDIEASTKQNMINIKTLEIEQTGFSKIKEGDSVHFSAKKTKTEKGFSNRMAAQKILIIPQEYFIK